MADDNTETSTNLLLLEPTKSELNDIKHKGSAWIQAQMLSNQEEIPNSSKWGTEPSYHT